MLSRLKSLLLTTLLGAAFVALPALADEAALAKLSARLDPLKSMRAQFVQTVTDEKGKVLQTSQGTLAVKRGNHLRWETTAPFAYLIVTDGQKLWRFDRDLDQITRQAFKGELAATPALIFSGDSKLIGTNYDVRWEQGKAGDRFVLAPKEKGALFHALTLVFNADKVAQLILQDNLDQRTDIVFSAVAANPILDDSLFQFAAPPGIDIIDEP